MPFISPMYPRCLLHALRGATGLGPRGDVIAELDWCVGEVMAALEKEGILDNTMIIFPVIMDRYWMMVIWTEHMN